MGDTIYKNSDAVGSELKDLILKTAGKVIIKVKDRYYPVDFKNLTGGDSEESKSNVIVVNTQQEALKLPYPGDNTLVVSLDGYMYLCSNGKFNEIAIKNIGTNTEFGDLTINGQLTINAKNGKSPLNVSSKVLNKNLNAEYLNGISSDKFAQKALNEKITGQWLFNQAVYVNEILKSTNSKNSLYHTILDFKNSSLDIDYINVRKALRVYEYIINTIKATNGSLWVSDSAEVKEVISVTDYIPVIEDAYQRIYKDYAFGKLDNQWHSLNEWYAIFIKNYNPETKEEVAPVMIDLNNSNDVARANSLLYTNEILSKELGYIYTATYPDGRVVENERYDVSYWSDVIYNCWQNSRDINLIFSGQTGIYILECRNNIVPFWINDVVRCQKIEDQINVYNYEGVVCGVSADSVVIKFKETGINIVAGDSLVRIDNVVNPERRGAIYLTSSDYKAPYIDIIDNSEYQYKVKKNENGDSSAQPNKDDVYVDNSNIKVRIGRLDGLAYDQLFGRMKGMGIYLEGKLDSKFIPVTINNINPDVSPPRRFTDKEVIAYNAKGYNGGIYIKDGTIQLGSAKNDNNRIGVLLSPDGSGWLAQGSIFWNKNGELTLSGDNSNLNIINANINLGRNQDGSFKIHLNRDGSGHLANGAITWSKDGQLIIGSISSSIYVRGTCLDNALSGNLKIYVGGNLKTNKEYYSRGHTLIQIDRSTMEIVSEQNFDTYSSTTSLTNTLNSITNTNNFIILLTYDACSLDTQLINALLNFGSGGYTNPFNSVRYPHIFIGYKGLSKGSALENLQMNSTPAEATCYVMNRMLSGTNAPGIADQIAKETYNAKNDTARRLGYAGWDDMVAQTGGDLFNRTIIDDGFIRTGVLNADKIITEIIQVKDITTGNLTVTDGAKIGGFSIVGDSIVSSTDSSNDSCIILRNLSTSKEIKIGSNTSPSYSIPILCRIKNEDDTYPAEPNICMWVSAKNAHVNLAMVGSGNIVSNGLVGGWKRHEISTPYDQVDIPNITSNTLMVVIQQDISGVGLPSLDDVFASIGKGYGGTSFFSIQYNICCSIKSTKHGAIWGRNKVVPDMNIDTLPRIIHYGDGVYVDKIDIARGDTVQFILDYDGWNYVAYIMSHQQ